VKLLLDHCTPRPFGRLLVGHDVRTAFQMGWAKLQNGALLSAAAAEEFGAFITVDRNLSFQQNKGEMPLTVVALVVPDNKPQTLAPLVPGVLRVLNSGPQNRVYVIGPPERRGT